MRPPRLIELWGPVALFMFGLLVLSTRERVPGSDIVWDKLAHASVYAAFALTSLRACHGGLRPLSLGRTALALTLVLAYALLDELTQAFVPGRHASVADGLADALGAAASVPLFAAAVRWRRRAPEPGPLGGSAPSRSTAGGRSR